MEVSKMTDKELADLIEEILLEASGVNFIDDNPIDTTNWTKKDFEREIEKRRQMIIANQNAFGVSKIKVQSD